MRRFLLAYVPYSQLFVSAGSGEQRSSGIPRERLHNIIVFESEASRPNLYIPEFNSVVARGASKDVFGRGIEEDVSDLSKYDMMSVVVQFGGTSATLSVHSIL